MNKYIKAALSISSVAMLFYILHDQHNKIKECRAKIEEQQRVMDSIQTEAMTTSIQLGRYEIAIDALAEHDSAAAQKIIDELKDIE
jgi:hypothetical protein